MKRLFDIVSSLILLILLSPLIATSIILIILFSGTPIFFLQDRLGKDFKVYKIIKFRTMKVNSEKEHTGLFSFEDDPRITQIGKYLRMLSIDEMPQLFNVLRGDMSLVGPRPAVTYELGEISDLPSEYLPRFKVKPGITGLAQVNGRNDLTWDEKVSYDNLYIDKYKKYSVLLDIYISIITPFQLLKLKSVIEKRND